MTTFGSRVREAGTGASVGAAAVGASRGNGVVPIMERSNGSVIGLEGDDECQTVLVDGVLLLAD